MNALHEACSPQCFMILMQSIRRVMDKGVTLWAPPCHSWIFLSRGTYLRSANDPHGDLDSEEAQSQNRLVKRVCLLLRLATALGIFWLVEQPLSSLLCNLPEFMRLKMYRAFLWMRAYGGSCPKGTVIWGNAPWLHKLRRTLSPADRTTDSSVEITKTGTKQDGSVCVFQVVKT